MSRRVACHFPVQATCDLDVLRAECESNFPTACFELMRTPRRDKTLYNHGIAVALESCAEGDAHNCIDTHEKFEDTERACLYTDYCLGLSEAFRSQEKPLAERDALERECQYRRDPMACAILAEFYVESRFPEPFLGRAQALKAWACPRIPEFPPSICRDTP